ncbi:class I adenylate-forming enzyme family protein [Microbulbifer spongiae]|uniref:Acyl--CoA ligase n=1 Tax=Microbulbifer spongiae TaxID=2944933 RepID=A0ABY9EC24_9GAMM|nr:class I adenylate-forming enzyme family protein [Microbulbifer sp. MI-G]WKD49024.1 acyl--CoA ligase [Microbulbifer sp. MI-G]
MNISILLQMPAQTFPNRTALTYRSGHYTYKQIYAAAQRAARLFQYSGFNFIAYLDANSPAVPISIFAAAIAGIPYVPLNYRLSKSELESLLSRLNKAYVISNQMPELALPGCTYQLTETFCQTMLAADEPDEELDPVTDAEESIAIQLFTSGTTGAPKAALLQHKHLMSYILNTVAFAAATEAEATLVSVPPYHIAGISAMLSSFYSGRRIVHMKNFDASEWLFLCEREKVTQAFVVPTMLSKIMTEHKQQGQTLNSLQAIAYGGGKMPLSTIEEALQYFPGVDFANAYGLTESSSTVCVLDPEQHREAFKSKKPALRNRLQSVGKPVPGIELQIRDDKNQPLAAGQTGEVFLRGDQISGKYREKESLQSDGWFPTRDHGYIDDSGFLYLMGRADDIIVRGGENISPGDIESVIRESPAVADVAVVGIADEHWGEAIAAAIVLTEDHSISDDEIAVMITARLRSSRVPSKIIRVEHLPYNEMGKILRRKVKQLLEEH